MTANKRIFLNVIATYGRSLFALTCGIFTSRWMLMALGQTDFGLFSVVGALVSFISIVNVMLAGAVQRFYAFSIGAAKGSLEGVEDCRRWFSTAVFCHLILAVTLVLIGYPVGVWAIKEYLTIPVDRIETCVWVFRFSCLSCFVGMAEVPFSAMFTAKQYIAELTLYSITQTALRTCILFYMVHHEGDWLFWLSLWISLCTFGPQCLIVCRAIKIFPECRLNISYCFDRERIRQLAAYAGWNALGCTGWLLSVQGMAIFANKCYGPVVNAAMGVANTVKGQSASLSAAMQGAFSPAITTALGAGNRDQFLRYAMRASKFSTVSTLLFALPLVCELRNVIDIWLVAPPPYAVGLCALALVSLIVDNMGSGHKSAVYATGNIAAFTMFGESMLILSLPIATLLYLVWRSPYVVGASFLCVTVLNTIMRVNFAKKQAGLSIRLWVQQCFLPISIVITLCLLIGSVSVHALEPTILRIIITTVVVELAYIPLVWKIVLSKDERNFVAGKISGYLRRF